MRGYLTIEQVGKTFDTGSGRFIALSNVSLAIEKNEFVTIIGHSGCGKSTLLNIVAGLSLPTTGAVLLDGAVVDQPGPDRAVVFQNHSLLPWLSAYANVRLAVDKVFGKSKSSKERDEWTRHNLSLVHMEHALEKKPDELSGGMRQRVGIARALAMQPKIMLLDEPFGALDALTRAHLQDTVMEIHQATKSTTIMITHDVDEAVLLSDRIVMMTNGPSATIGEICQVKLDRPRRRLEVADTVEYARCRKQVLQFLYERHAKAA
ncbi:MAG TPA: ABC transporter ATP-binding protein [Rhizomicrobium sp.]|nr:ABC transporter ATP-binding protein [Rhizomicrobium sp.]